MDGDRYALSQAITLLESTRGADRRKGEEILEACTSESGGALRIAVTGAPGSGKSTLIEALGLQHY